MATHADTEIEGHFRGTFFPVSVFKRTAKWIGDDIVGAGDEMPVELARTFLKYLTAGGADTTRPAELMLELEIKLCTELAHKPDDHPTTHWSGWAQAAGKLAELTARYDTTRGDAAAKRLAKIHSAAWALGAMLEGVDFKHEPETPPGTLLTTAAGTIAIALPPCDGDNTRANVADVRNLAARIGIQCPPNIQDGPEWQAVLKLISSKLRPLAIIKLAAVRHDAEWTQTLLQIRADGCAEEAPRRAAPGAGAAVSQDAIRDAVFGTGDAAMADADVDRVFASLPPTGTVRKNCAVTSSQNVKRMRVAASVATATEALGLTLSEVTPPAAVGGLTIMDQTALTLLNIEERYQAFLLKQQAASEAEHRAKEARIDPTAATSELGRLQQFQSLLTGQATRQATHAGMIVVGNGASDESETSDAATPALVARAKTDLEALKAREAGEELDFVKRLHESDSSLYKLMAKPVADTKAATDPHYSTIKQAKRILVGAGVAFVRMDSRPFSSAPGVDLSDKSAREILKGEFMANSPHKVAYPVVFPTFPDFTNSLFGADAFSFYVTLERWAGLVDVLLKVGALQMVGRYAQLCRERQDQGLLYGWGRQHCVDYLVHIVHTYERMFKEWLKDVSLSTLRPNLSDFESWPGMKEVLDTKVAAWNSASGVDKPPHLRPFEYSPKAKAAAAPKAEKRKERDDDDDATPRTPTAATAQSPIDLATLTKTITDVVRSEVKRSRTTKETREDKRKQPAEKTAAKAAEKAATTKAGPKTSAKSRRTKRGQACGSVVGEARSENAIPQLLRQQETRDVINKYDELGVDGEHSTCRGWLACGRCALDTDGDLADLPKCRWGAHYCTEASKGPCEGFVRDLAEAEGRDASGFDGISDADIRP